MPPLGNLCKRVGSGGREKWDRSGVKNRKCFLRILVCYFLLPYKVLQNKSTINLSGGDATGDHLILHLGDFFWEI